MKNRVLVIGGGGAGLTAAISAAKEGASVCLLSKTPPGWNACTAYAGGIFTLASGGVTPEEHYAKTMETGCLANDPALVRTLAEEAEKTLLTLESWGVGIRFPRPGKASVRHTAAHGMMGGEGLNSELAAIAREEGVEIRCFSAVTRLLLDDRGFRGAETVDWKGGKASVISADSVVIATGGAGRIFSRTDNPARLTGDGFALAVDAGLRLRDMEFIQFYPLGWDDPELPVWMADLGLIDFVPLTDANGNEFLLRDLREWGFKDGEQGNLYARDRAAVAVARADREGGAFLHLQAAAPGLWENKVFRRKLVIDPARLKKLGRPVRVAPLEHYFCGGIVIDPDGRTDIPGVFACGECTGGVDGANRIGGNALANIVTFGLRAGAAAAHEKRSVSFGGESAAGIPSFGASGTSPSLLRAKLQKKMWECLGPIRNEQGLRSALEFLDGIERVKMRALTPVELLCALEMPGLIASSRACARAALARRESLGVHFRED